MKGKLSIIALTMLLVACGSLRQTAEVPERLKAKKMTSLSTAEKGEGPDDGYSYRTIRDRETFIGCLMEPTDTLLSRWTISFYLHRTDVTPLSGITLKELRKSEQQMVDILNDYVDWAQQVHICFTSPRFYNHSRQYLFYDDPAGHRHLFLTFIDFGNEPEDLQRIIMVCDGGDGFWQADFDLTERKLKWFDVNGPTIYMVPGRSKEPRGLRKKSRFYSGVYAPFNYIDEEELPEAAKTFCDQGLTKNLQRREDGLFCYDILNGPRAYFDSTGNFVASMAETWDKEIDMEEYFSSMMPALETMMNIMQLDLQRHDDEGQLNVFWVERIEGKWLIGAVMRKDYEFGTEAFYTFNDQGELVGVDRLRH